MDADEKLKLDYEKTLDYWKTLTDLRFRLLAFLPVIAGAAIVFLGGNPAGNTSNTPASTPLASVSSTPTSTPTSSQTSTPTSSQTSNLAITDRQLAIGILGFCVTLGIIIYDLRNTLFYEAAVHRIGQLEIALMFRSYTPGLQAGGLFNDARRRPSETRTTWKRILLERLLGLPIQHDFGLALVYDASLGGWAYIITATPAPHPVFDRGWSPLVVAGLIGFVFGVNLVIIDRCRLRRRPMIDRCSRCGGTMLSKQVSEGASLSTLWTCKNCAKTVNCPDKPSIWCKLHTKLLHSRLVETDGQKRGGVKAADGSAPGAEPIGSATSATPPSNATTDA